MSIELVLVPLALAISGAIAEKSHNETIKYEDVNNITKNKNIDNKVCYQVETPIKRMDLLLKGIEELGYDSKYDDIEFILNNNNQIDILFSSSYSKEQVQNISSDIYNQYTSVLQSQVYNTLKQKAAERGYTLENEVIEDDNSIVLNFVV